jgi:hypothetical protein
MAPCPADGGPDALQTAVVKYDPAGDVAWQQVLGCSSGASGSLALDLYGNVAFTSGREVARLRQHGGSIGTRYCVGAPNSVGAGASISATGSTTVSDGDLTLSAAGLPVGQFGLFYFGTGQVDVPFGDGFRCVGGTTWRLGPATTADGTGELKRVVALGLPPASGVIVPGSTRYFQCWYRDPAAGGASFNLSDALRIAFQQRGRADVRLHRRPAMGRPVRVLRPRRDRRAEGAGARPSPHGPGAVRAGDELALAVPALALGEGHAAPAPGHVRQRGERAARRREELHRELHRRAHPARAEGAPDRAPHGAVEQEADDPAVHEADLVAVLRPGHEPELDAAVLVVDRLDAEVLVGGAVQAASLRGRRPGFKARAARRRGEGARGSPCAPRQDQAGHRQELPWPTLRRIPTLGALDEPSSGTRPMMLIAPHAWRNPRERRRDRRASSPSGAPPPAGPDDPAGRLLRRPSRPTRPTGLAPGG